MLGSNRKFTSLARARAFHAWARTSRDLPTPPREQDESGAFSRGSAPGLTVLPSYGAHATRRGGSEGLGLSGLLGSGLWAPVHEKCQHVLHGEELGGWRVTRRNHAGTGATRDPVSETHAASQSQQSSWAGAAQSGGVLGTFTLLLRGGLPCSRGDSLAVVDRSRVARCWRVGL